VYVRSVERIVEQLKAGETGVEKYEIVSDKDPSVMSLAEWLDEIAADECGMDADMELVENPRSAETLVDTFEVSTATAREELGWEPRETVRDSIRELVSVSQPTSS